MSNSTTSKGKKVLVNLLTNVSNRATEFFQRKPHLIPQLLLCWYPGCDKIFSLIAAFTLENIKKIQLALGQVNNMGG
jgi:hypothetical protein